MRFMCYMLFKRKHTHKNSSFRLPATKDNPTGAFSILAMGMEISGNLPAPEKDVTAIVGR